MIQETRAGDTDTVVSDVGVSNCLLSLSSQTQRYVTPYLMHSVLQALLCKYSDALFYEQADNYRRILAFKPLVAGKNENGST